MKTYIYRVDYRLTKMLEEHPYMSKTPFGNNQYVYCVIPAYNAFEAYEKLLSEKFLPRVMMDFIIMISRKERTPSTKWWNVMKLSDNKEIYYM